MPADAKVIFLRGFYQFRDGVLSSATSDKYVGEFLNGAFNGKGKQVKASEFYRVGVFKNSNPVEIKCYNPSNQEITMEEFKKH